MKNKKTISIIEGYPEGQKAIQKAIKKLEKDKLERNVYILELVRNYYNQKVLTDKLILGDKKRAAKECVNMLEKLSELDIKFIMKDINNLIEREFFYQGYAESIYRDIVSTYNKYKEINNEG